MRAAMSPYGTKAKFGPLSASKRLSDIIETRLNVELGLEADKGPNFACFALDVPPSLIMVFVMRLA